MNENMNMNTCVFFVCLLVRLFLPLDYLHLLLMGWMTPKKWYRSLSPSLILVFSYNVSACIPIHTVKVPYNVSNEYVYLINATQVSTKHLYMSTVWFNWRLLHMFDKVKYTRVMKQWRRSMEMDFCCCGFFLLCLCPVIQCYCFNVIGRQRKLIH